MSERTPVLRLLPTEEEATDPGPRCPGKREEELLRVCVCARVCLLIYIFACIRAPYLHTYSYAYLYLYPVSCV